MRPVFSLRITRDDSKEGREGTGGMNGPEKISRPPADRTISPAWVRRAIASSPGIRRVQRHFSSFVLSQYGVRFWNRLFFWSELAIIVGVVGTTDVLAGGMAITSIAIIQRWWRELGDVLRSPLRTLALWLSISVLIDAIVISASLLFGFHVAAPGFIRTVENHIALVEPAMVVSSALLLMRVTIVIVFRLSEWASPSVGRDD